MTAGFGLTAALGNVVDDGPLVRVTWPGVPGQGDGVSGVGADVELAGRGALVAGNVGSTVRVGGHEAQILVQGVPSDRGWRCARGVIVPDRVATRHPGATVDPDAVDKAVGACEIQERGGDCQKNGGGMHCI